MANRRIRAGSKAAVEITVGVPPALRRDLQRLVKAEGPKMTVSRLCAGLIRLGIGRYFELSDARKARPLAEAMKDLFDEEDVFASLRVVRIPPSRPYGIQNPKFKERMARHRAERALRAVSDAAFDAALEEGARRFEALSR